MRRLEVLTKPGDGQHVNLTLNDSRITMKVPQGYPTHLSAAAAEFAQRVAEHVPYYRYPTLRGTIFNAQYVRLRDTNRKIALVFDDKEA